MGEESIEGIGIINLSGSIEEFVLRSDGKYIITGQNGDVVGLTDSITRVHTFNEYDAEALANKAKLIIRDYTPYIIKSEFWYDQWYVIVLPKASEEPIKKKEKIKVTTVDSIEEFTSRINGKYVSTDENGDICYTHNISSAEIFNDMQAQEMAETLSERGDFVYIVRTKLLDFLYVVVSEKTLENLAKIAYANMLFKIKTDDEDRLASELGGEYIHLQHIGNTIVPVTTPNISEATRFDIASGKNTCRYLSEQGVYKTYAVILPDNRVHIIAVPIKEEPMEENKNEESVLNDESVDVVEKLVVKNVTDFVSSINGEYSVSRPSGISYTQAKEIASFYSIHRACDVTKTILECEPEYTPYMIRDDSCYDRWYVVVVKKSKCGAKNKAPEDENLKEMMKGSCILRWNVKVYDKYLVTDECCSTAGFTKNAEEASVFEKRDAKIIADKLGAELSPIIIDTKNEYRVVKDLKGMGNIFGKGAWVIARRNVKDDGYSFLTLSSGFNPLSQKYYESNVTYTTLKFELNRDAIRFKNHYMRGEDKVWYIPECVLGDNPSNLVKAGTYEDLILDDYNKKPVYDDKDVDDFMLTVKYGYDDEITKAEAASLLTYFHHSISDIHQKYYDAIPEELRPQFTKDIKAALDDIPKRGK